MFEFQNLDELLKYEPLRKRPGMYIGSERISDFFYFIIGFTFRPNVGASPLYGFATWLANFYGLNGCCEEGSGFEKSIKQWVFIILDAEDGNEEAALRKFFELYDEFKAEVSE